jgi:hypothetical protein
LTDPDSLTTAPNSDLLLSSGADGVIVDVHHAGQADQSVSFTQILDSNGMPATNLDDVIKTNADSGTFYISDTHDNRVVSVHISDLNPQDYYVSLGNAFGQVDPTTGNFTPLVTGLNGAHGVAFVADQHDDTSDHHDVTSDTTHQSGESPAITAPLNDAQLAVLGITNTHLAV